MQQIDAFRSDFDHPSHAVDVRAITDSCYRDETDQRFSYESVMVSNNVQTDIDFLLCPWIINIHAYTISFLMLSP